MITVGCDMGDTGIVLYRRDFVEHGIEETADVFGEHFIAHFSLGKMKSCDGCTRLLGDLDGIVFWAYPSMFPGDENGDASLCGACRNIWR